MLSRKVYLSGRQSVGGKLLENNVFISDTVYLFMDSRYLNGFMTTFYTYLHPTPLLGTGMVMAEPLPHSDAAEGRGCG